MLRRYNQEIKAVTSHNLKSQSSYTKMAKINLNKIFYVSNMVFKEWAMFN